jgi:hypothetical protein
VIKASPLGTAFGTGKLATSTPLQGIVLNLYTIGRKSRSENATVAWHGWLDTFSKLNE